MVDINTMTLHNHW